MPDGLENLAKLFADDTSLFSTIHNPLTSQRSLNSDLRKFTNWAYQWKMVFNPKIESIQFNTTLDITGTIPGTSMIKLYNELGLEHLPDRRWCRKLCFLYKIQNKK